MAGICADRHGLNALMRNGINFGRSYSTLIEEKEETQNPFDDWPYMQNCAPKSFPDSLHELIRARNQWREKAEPVCIGWRDNLSFLRGIIRAHGIDTVKDLVKALEKAENPSEHFLPTDIHPREIGETIMEMLNYDEINGVYDIDEDEAIKRANSWIKLEAVKAQWQIIGEGDTDSDSFWIAFNRIDKILEGEE